MASYFGFSSRGDPSGGNRAVYPRTRVLGAIVLTGYLGRAIATHFRISSPLFTHTLFGVYVGLLMWLGLILRNKALRGVLGSSC